MPRKWYEGKVTTIQTLSPTTKQFTIKPPTVLDFKPGQFITMDLPIHEKRRQRWRSYSIASAPTESGEIDLCIVHLEGGLGSTYLFEQIEEGSIISFKGPDGVFTLSDATIANKELVFICTGTGIAPFRSMILDIVKNKKTFQSIHLIFGTRYEDNVLYREEMETLAAAYDNFRYDICLSRQSDWKEYQGYVHQVYQNEYQKLNENRLFLICGWSNMVDEASKNLLDMGYSSRQIIYELYG